MISSGLKRRLRKRLEGVDEGVKLDRLHTAQDQ
jgi:hypothetical protein